MKDRSRSQKKKTKNINAPVSGRQNSENDALPEALQRIKDNRYPHMKSGDMLGIQQGIGNKALGSLFENRLFGVQRHSLPSSRQGVGDEEDEIQSSPVDAAVQRHSLPSNREGVGEEDDEIQFMPVQRALAFGRQQTSRPQRPHLWGDRNRPVVQLKNGKSPAAPKDEIKVDPKTAPEPKKMDAKTAEEEAAKKQAETEYKKFTAGGPYKINPYVPDQVDNFGKFDSIYDPANRTLTADMRVKFDFPDLPLPKGDSLLNLIQAPIIETVHDTYAQNFIAQVHKGWSGRFTFRNIREPQSVWGKLNPIAVKVNVQPVKSNQHYLVKGYFKKTGTANVTSNTPAKNNPSPATLTLFKGDLDAMTQGFTGYKQTGADEVKRLQRNLPKIHFANESMTIEDKYIPDLQYVADYLKMMNRPKFIINVVGHANKTGNEKNNIKYSAQRAQVVANRLKAFGVTNHTVSASGIGSKGATASGAWRKVDFNIGVDKSFSNVQDVTVHEFGHMLGLDDEYVRGAKDKRTHTTQKAFMAKMLGEETYGKGSEGKLGEEVTSVLPMASASVMESGNEVRPYHYVTLWQALYDTAANAASQPVPPFTWKDWKVSGY